MSQIRCVMFDCFNVLSPFDTPSFFSFINKYKGNSLAPENIFSGPGLDLLRNYDLGLMSNTEFFIGVKTLFQLEGVCRKLFFSLLGSIVKPDREMLAIVNELRRRGVATVMVSNMNSFYAGHLMEYYPEFMEGYDYKMISCEEGVAKPNPEAWTRPLDFLGLKAEECIFVDDMMENVEAARKLGIKGWHYNSTDGNFCSSGKLEAERNKLKNFLSCLDSIGLLYKKTR